MIQVFHNNSSITKVLNYKTEIKGFNDLNIVEGLFEIANQFQDELIIWVYDNLIDHINFEAISEVNSFEIHSYNLSNKSIIKPELGYVDHRSPFININYSVKYSTWELSTDIGVIHAKILLIFSFFSTIKKFDFFLLNLGKSAMKSGVFTYSNPNLLQNHTKLIERKKEISIFELFHFTKVHYTFKMYLFLIVSIFYYQKATPISAFFKYLFAKKGRSFYLEVDETFKKFTKNKKKDSTNSIDVIIPTLGRKNYLFDFLKDLNQQSLLPKRVIIIEQIDSELPITELQYLKDESWKFEIVHQVINKLGACNARNLAIKEVRSSWVFFADDDIRISNNCIEKTIDFLIEFSIDSCSLASYIKKEQIDTFVNPYFWGEFSSGCSIVNSNFIENNYFNMLYEFGLGEDTDYGCKLRNMGCSIVYYNKFPVSHLKAPIGGFRKKITRTWEKDSTQPFPQPTATRCIMENYNEYQFLGFKLYYVIKRMRFLRPLLSFKQFNKSVEYAVLIDF